MFNFDFLEKGLRIGSSSHIVFDFCYILLTDQISLSDCPWLSLLLEILGNMCVAIVCFPDCDVMNFEINHIF